MAFSEKSLLDGFCGRCTQKGARSINKPKMILFDYGHTLLYEPGYDFLRGEQALFPYITKNKYNLTPEEVSAFAGKLFETFGDVRRIGMELHERQFQRMLYEYLGIAFSISYEEAELIQWSAISPGAIMPRADKMIDYINEKGILSGVISNIGWSRNALRERFARLLPNNRFAFIITSSEYGFRKPSPFLFDLALKKADLSPEDVWFCGDNPQADVEGAAQVGIFPVWYDNDTQKDYKDRSDETPPQCEHLHIKEWHELIETIENLDSCL